MQRRYRLTENSDFKRVRREGRSWAHPLLVLYACPGEPDTLRVGIAVGRRVGSAVVRNRIKRRIREAIRRQLPAIESGWDLLFVARPSSATAGYQQLSRAVERLLQPVGDGLC